MTDRIKVLEPDPLKITVDIKQLPYCPDSHDGIIDLTPMGGNNYDYAITWQSSLNLQDSVIFTGKTGDTYSYANVSQNLYYLKVVTTRTLEDHKQCILIDTLNIKGIRGGCLNIPGAFFADKSTGNFGEKNLFWQIRVGANAEQVSQYYPDAIVRVYDRWGRKVWESQKGYKQDWSGQNLDIGAYYYVIELNLNNRPPITGTVNLLRVNE